MTDSLRKGTIALGTTTVLAAGFLAGCSSHRGEEYAGICRDPQTGKRLPDSECSTTGHHHGAWVFYRMGARVPSVGSSMSGYATTIPRNATYAAGGFSAQGGTVSSDSVKAGTPMRGADGSSKGTVVRGGFGKGGGGGHGEGHGG